MPSAGGDVLVGGKGWIHPPLNTTQGGLIQFDNGFGSWEDWTLCVARGIFSKPPDILQGKYERRNGFVSEVGMRNKCKCLTIFINVCM